MKTQTALIALPISTLLIAISLITGCGGDSDEGGSATSGGGHSHPAGVTSCFICDASKRDAGRLWCKEHGRYEDRCWLCHPEIEEKDRLYCTEHYLYEDECFLCDPSRMPTSTGDGHKNEAEHDDHEGHDHGALAPTEDDHAGHDHGSHGGHVVTNGELFCVEHNLPEKECGICQPQLAKDLEVGKSMKVRMVSPQAANKAGVQTDTPKYASTRSSISAFGEVRYNENAMTRITPLTNGVIRKVIADVGEVVNEGDVLAEIHSAEVAEAKSALLSAIVDFEIKQQTLTRETKLVAQELAPQSRVDQANATVKVAQIAMHNAKQKLANLGFSDDEVAKIADEQDGSALLPVRAPYTGTLVTRHAVVGEAVEPGHAMFTLADLSTMWIELSIPADNVAAIRSGLELEVTLTNLPGQAVKGELVWVDSAIDPKSRMIKARAVVPNEDGMLKSGMFGRARVITRQDGESLTVPSTSIQKYENQPYVFVRMDDDLFALRRVTATTCDGGLTSISAGLDADEQIVVGGSFTMMSEYLKSRLGAGCTH